MPSSFLSTFYPTRQLNFGTTQPFCLKGAGCCALRLRVHRVFASMPHKKDGEVVGRSTKSLSLDEDMDGMRARVKNLEITLVDFDQMVARLAAVERDLESCKGDLDSEARR